jgi:epoxide hydrolase 4
MLKDEYLSTKSLRLHYVSAGEGDLILFLHGFPEFWYAWKSQLVEFGKDCRAVALDLPGYNLSDKPKELPAYEVQRMVENVSAFACELSPGKRFVLVGHDWGGYIAWAFAMTHPEMLDKLVILNAPHPVIFARLLSSDPAQQKASGYMELFRGAQAEEILSGNDFEFLSRVVGFERENGLPPEDKPEYLDAWSQHGAITGGLNYYRANRLASSTCEENYRRFPKIEVPTLVIWGMKDPALLPQNLDGLEEHVTRLTIERIPDASHWLVHTHAGRVNDLIRAFLR